MKTPGTRERMNGKIGVFLLAGILGFYWNTAESWGAKSLWELRGQKVDQESSQGETSQQTETEPQTPAPTPAVKEADLEIASFIESMTIPSQYGRVKEKFTGSDQRLFVLLQEIHNHPEVQKNNKEIITVLLDQYQMPVIFIEGYYGLLKLPNLLAQPKEWRQRMATQKLGTGYYTAEEYLYLTREPTPVVIGVDDEKIVREQYDLIHYQYMVENRSKADAVFGRLSEAIEQAKAKWYNPLLKAFDASSQEYLQDKISAEEFITVLHQALQDHNMPFYEETYPNIALVVKSSQAEEKEEYEQAEEYSQKVDHSKLFGEIRNLEKELRSKWYKGTQERQLDKLARGVYYLQKLSKISLVPLEWEEYIQEIAPFTIGDLARLLKENNISVNAADEEITFLDHYRQEGETFYKIAIDRERAMVENSLAAMQQQSVTKGILRTGGFHTSGISQFLKANGISYLVIAPRVTQPDMPTPYQEILKETMEKVSRSSLPTEVTNATLARQRAVKPAILDQDHEPK